MAHRHSVIDHPTQLFGIAAMAAAIGALSAMLFAPKAGTQTRQEIRDRAMDLRNKIQHPKDSMTDSLEAPIDHVSEVVHPTRGRPKGAASKIHNDAELTKKELNEEIQDEADHIRRHGEL